MTGRAEDFVRRFSEFWRDPDPDRLGELLCADVRLVQPLAPETRGLRAAQAGFRRLFAGLPDLRGTVDRWSGDDDCVFIEFRLHATIGARRVEWPAVDRFFLDRAKATERVSYFDGLPLLLRLLASPRAAWRWWRAG